MIYTIEITNRSGAVEFHVEEKGTAFEKQQQKMKEVTEALNVFLEQLRSLESETR